MLKARTRGSRAKSVRSSRVWNRIRGELRKSGRRVPGNDVGEHQIPRRVEARVRAVAHSLEHGERFPAPPHRGVHAAAQHLRVRRCAQTLDGTITTA